MPEQKFLNIDIGSAWTKAFLVNVDSENRVNVEKSSRLPTSWGDFAFGVNLLLSKISVPGVTQIYVSHLPEVENLAKKQKGAFVKEQDAADALVRFLKKTDTNVSILDGGASNLHERVRAEEVGKYLTFHSSAIFLENFIGKKKFKAHLLPIDTKELEVEEAFLRSSFQQKLADIAINKKILIAATGGMMSGSPRLSRMALLILDILGPGTTAQVVFDREFFLPSFGALLEKYKQLHMATPGSWLETLGAFVSLGGSQSVELDWGYSQLQQVELTDGEISLVPAPPEQKIKLGIQLNKKEKRTHDISGGSLGVILDARSKPLTLMFGQSASRKLMTKWLKELERAEINKEAF
jgi:hypothetical protein